MNNEHPNRGPEFFEAEIASLRAEMDGLRAEVAALRARLDGPAADSSKSGDVLARTASISATVQRDAEAVAATAAADPFSRLKEIVPDKYPSKREAREALVRALTDFWNEGKTKSGFGEEDFTAKLGEVGLAVKKIGPGLLMVKIPAQFYDQSELHVYSQGYSDEEFSPRDGVLVFPSFMDGLCFEDVRSFFTQNPSAKGDFNLITAVETPATGDPRYLWKDSIYPRDAMQMLGSKGKLS